MSRIREEIITCPQCLQEGKIEIWDSINVTLNPELREKIFNEELFIWTCPKCGQKIFVPWGTLYHDMTHKFMLFYSFEKNDEDVYTPIEIPKILGISEGYIFRWVYGLMNLKEKILILENGLNDIVIERMKYRISHLTVPEISQKGYKLYFTDIDTEQGEFGEIHFTYFDQNQKTKHLKFDMEKYYEHKSIIESDSRFHTESADCIDQGWIDLKLKCAE